MKITYEAWTPRPEALAIIAQAEQIGASYAAQGYDLTLRQLYYQFVTRNLIPNTEQSYKRLGDIINRARMAGLLDWNYIVDRTRNLRGTSHWDTPGSIISSAAHSFRLDKWADQPRRVEVWVEKEALAGVIERVANIHDVDWFSCRGYVSQSELWAAGRRHLGYIRGGQDVTVLHLGDHDPSGIDMTRDIEDRLTTFIGARAYSSLEVRRIALTIEQVEQYNPPPNPAKLTDSRSNGYVDRFGSESWELDALDPATLAALVTEHVEGIVDAGLFEAQREAEQRHRDTLSEASQRWDEVAEYLRGEEADDE